MPEEGLWNLHERTRLDGTADDTYVQPKWHGLEVPPRPTPESNSRRQRVDLPAVNRENIKLERAAERELSAALEPSHRANPERTGALIRKMRWVAIGQQYHVRFAWEVAFVHGRG